MKLADVEEIEKVFNETFVPASDHDFMPITSNEDGFIDEDPSDNIDSKDTVTNNPNNREIFFALRSYLFEEKMRNHTPQHLTIEKAHFLFQD